MFSQELDTVRVSVHGYVEAAEFVAGEGVGTALEDNGRGLENLEDFGDYLHGFRNRRGRGTRDTHRFEYTLK